MKRQRLIKAEPRKVRQHRVQAFAKFFRCTKGHTEEWLGESDNPSMPWRPCSRCKSRMILTTLKIVRDRPSGKFYLDDPKPKKPKQSVPEKQRKLLKKNVLVMRLFRQLPREYHYCLDPVTNTLQRLAEKPRIIGDYRYTRNAQIIVNEVEQTLIIHFYGTCGWWEDVRGAGRRTKIKVVARFEEPHRELIRKNGKFITPISMT